MLISPAFAQTAPAASGSALAQFLPLILIFLVFYFLLIRPQQKRAKQHRDMVASVRRGDSVVTGGGIVGKVVRVIDDNEALIEIADGVKVRILKTTIADVRTKPEPAQAPPAKAD